MLACLVTVSFAVPSIADDRMAGSAAHQNRADSNAAEEMKSEHEESQDVGKTLSTDMEVLESRGLLYGATGGSLGPYLWEGADKELVFDLVEQLPDDNHYSVLYNLTLRALLTATNSNLMSGSRATKASEGRDFLTLRLEKLYEMGQFKETAALYTQSPFEPYHERQARIGVSALYISGQKPLACLETSAIKDRFAGMDFWTKMGSICSISMFGKDNSVTNAPDTAPKDAAEDSAKDGEGAKTEEKPFLSIYLGNKNKVFTPESIDILAKPSVLDIAWLIQNKQISYKKLGDPTPSAIPAALRAVLLTDTNLPNALKDAITAYNATYDKGLDTPLEKFEIKRESFMSGEPRNRLFSYIAYLITNNFSDVAVLPKEDVIEMLDQLNPIDRALIGIITEKLDKQAKLHNYVGREIYEKHTDLTFDDNYVMQSIGLMKSLQKARTENRLGEVILLGSIVLHETQPKNLRPDVFGEIIDSFVTVGLIYEVHQLTTEILLGFE